MENRYISLVTKSDGLLLNMANNGKKAIQRLLGNKADEHRICLQIICVGAAALEFVMRYVAYLSFAEDVANGRCASKC